MFKKAGLKVIKSRGAIVGEPDILRFLKISDFFDKRCPLLINSYFRVCDKIELAFKNVYPIKYFMGRVVLRGVKEYENKQ